LIFLQSPEPDVCVRVLRLLQRVLPALNPSTAAKFLGTSESTPSSLIKELLDAISNAFFRDYPFDLFIAHDAAVYAKDNKDAKTEDSSKKTQRPSKFVRHDAAPTLTSELVRLVRLLWFAPSWKETVVECLESAMTPLSGFFSSSFTVCIFSLS
jgi:hypothetical protein